MHETTNRIDASAFRSVEALQRQQDALDARGLRATASPAHEAYVDDLERRLLEAGVDDVRSEDVAVTRWTPSACALSVEVDGTWTPLEAQSYVPFSGSTPPGGVTGALSREIAPGVVAVIDIETLDVHLRDFAALDWDAPDLPLPREGLDYDDPFHRVWLSQDFMRQQLDAAREAGAAAVVLVLDGHAIETRGSYFLYDGVLRGVPALVVDRTVGRALHDALAAGGSATVTLEAVVDEVTSRNLYAVVPGETDELVLLQSHTDGTNGLEDNGPEAIVALADYLTDLPPGSLPRGVLLVLSTGHFVTHTGWGLASFLRDHRDDLVARTVAALSIEHLGARAWEPDGDHYRVGDDYELGCFFASPHRAVIDVVRRALDEAQVTDSLVMRPFTPDETGESPDGLGWPGDGTVLWNIGHLPSANFISGPGYLLTTMPTRDLVDVEALRRQAIAFGDAVLALTEVPRDVLAQRIDG